MDSFIVAKWGNSSIFSLMKKPYQPVDQPRALMINNPHNTRGRAREASADNQNAETEDRAPESEQKNDDNADGGLVDDNAEGGSEGSTGAAEDGSEGSTGVAPTATFGATGGETAAVVVNQNQSNEEVGEAVAQGSDPGDLPSSSGSESSGEAKGGGPTPGGASPAVRTPGNGLPAEGTIAFTTNQFAELMETLRTRKPATTTQDFELQYKFQMFSGDDADWIGFKRQLTSSYMIGRGVSRESMKSYVADFRENGTRPPPRVSTLLNSIFTTSLKREALSITNCHADAFDAYIGAVKKVRAHGDNQAPGYNQQALGWP